MAVSHSSPPDFRERLRPLISLWLDTLVLRLMNQGDPACASRRGSFWTNWRSLQALPQLHTAITENRKVEKSGGAGLSGPQPA